jgi:PAS domain S-box-containing protein
VLSKAVSVAVLVVFSYALLDQLQYILYIQRIVPDTYDLVALVGFSFVLVSLMRQKSIMFSSSVLSENILEHLTAPVFLMDLRGRIIYFNKVLQEITAFRPSELNGMPVKKLLPELKIAVDELINYGRYGMHNLRTRVRDAFDNDTKVVLSLRAIYDHSGEFEGVVCTLEGLNKPMQGQYDSRNQDERLLNAFAASDKGFWDWDIKQGELFFSETACYILGYDPAELANLSFSKWRDMLHYEFRDEYFDTLNKHLKQQSDTFYMEYKVKTKNSEWRWILDKGRITAFDSENNPERMSGVFTDITRVKVVEDNLRRFKRKLEETIKFKNRLIDLLSTDIREPFNAIIGLSEILSVGGELDTAEQQKFTREIESQASTAYQLIDEILHLAKIDEGRIKKEMETFLLRSVMLDLKETYREQLSAKQLQLRISEGNHTVKSDKQIIKRIMAVLIENAIKFSHEGQNIEVSWERDNSDIYLTVRDYGVGLTLKEQKKLFKIDESFVNRGTRGESGHGLGLVIADRLAKVVDAKILFRSSKNEGSEFTLKIPDA